jgi:Tol biopolymer transport system component
VTVTDVTPARFVVRGTSDADSPQGARAVALTIGSMASYKRLVPGTYATLGSGNNLTPTLDTGSCGSYSTGTMTVTEASFKLDGTPLVFAASYSACGVRGAIRLNAHDAIAEGLVSDHTNLTFGTVPLPDPHVTRAITFHNSGLVDEPLGTARTVNSDTAVAQAEFTLTADTCSGTTLAPGDSCSVTVAAHPAATGTRRGALVLPDQTALGNRGIELIATGIDKPYAPAHMWATPGFRLVDVSWDRTSGGVDAPATSYTLYRGSSADSLSPYAEVTPSGAAWTSQHYSDRDVTPGVTYYYAVTAANAVGTSGSSPTASATPVVTGTLVASDTWAVKSTDPDYVPDYDIGVLAPNGLQTRLTDDGGDHDTPAVSPDGTTIAYMSNSGNAPNDYDIWLQHLGSPAQRLTDDDATLDAQPVFSPDGPTIAFSRYADHSSSVWTVPVTGGKATLVPGGSNDNAPTWSPNGKMLAVATDAVHGDKTTSALAVEQLDGSHRRIVAGTDDVNGNIAAVGPSWSPDGTRLSFVRIDPNYMRLATVPVTGGGVSFLTYSSMFVFSQRWAPSGDRIVFDAISMNSPSTVWSVKTNGEYPVSVLGSETDNLFSPAAIEPSAPFEPAPLPAVTNLTATLQPAGTTLSWNAPADAQYVIVRRSAAGGAAPTSPTSGVAVYEGSASSTTVTGLAAGQKYAFAVFPVSALAETGTVAVTTVQPATTPGTPGPNGTVLTALSGVGPKFIASWGQPLPAGQSYEVQLGQRTFASVSQTWSAVTWSNFYSGGATSKVVPATAGTTYYLRSRVRDAGGHVTPWSSTAMAPVPYDDRALSAKGAWTPLTGQRGRLAGTLRQSSTAGAVLSLRQYGSSFSLIADKCPTCGKVKIFVDGALKATVDTYAKTASVRQQVWSTSFPSIGRHTVKIVVVGTAKRPTVRIDGLVARR